MDVTVVTVVVVTVVIALTSLALARDNAIGAAAA